MLSHFLFLTKNQLKWFYSLYVATLQFCVIHKTASLYVKRYQKYIDLSRKKESKKHSQILIMASPDGKATNIFIFVLYFKVLYKDHILLSHSIKSNIYSMLNE